MNKKQPAQPELAVQEDQTAHLSVDIQVRNLNTLIHFVNSQRVFGSNDFKKRANEYKNTTYHDITLQQSMTWFLEDFCSHAFSERTEQEKEDYEWWTGGLPDTFTDKTKWLESPKYQHFLQEVYNFYHKAVEELLASPKEVFLKYLYPAQLWQKYPLKQQLFFANPTASALGLTNFYEQLIPADNQNLYFELMTNVEDRFGIQCFSLLQELCNGFYYLVRRIRGVEENYQQVLRKAESKGNSKLPTKEKVIALCEASKKIEGVTRKRHCDQLVVKGKTEVVIIKAYDNRRGRNYRYCSKACNRRFNQNK